MPAIDYLLLTHAHLDHTGLIPRLVNQGLKAPILATSGSVDYNEGAFVHTLQPIPTLASASQTDRVLR